MASFVETEVEIQDVGNVEVQEVEVEQIPVEMPIEIVETSDNKAAVQQMISLHHAQSHDDEMILQTAGEEVVGDPNLVYVDTAPVVPEIEVSSDDVYMTDHRRLKGGKKKLVKAKNDSEIPLNELFIAPSMTPRRWEQKQVQIKTLEGEFSVTMWASGIIFQIALKEVV